MTDSSHLQLYVDESKEKLTELNNALLTLESEGEDREALDMSFRSAHTLKGNSKAMGYDAVGDLAHAVEDLLDGMRDDEIPITPETMDLAFEGLDEIEAAMSEIEAEGGVERDPEPVMRDIREGMGELPDGAESAAAANHSDGDEPAADADASGADANGVDPTAQSTGEDRHRLEIDMETGPIPGADALLVLEKIERTATLESTEPPREEVESGEFEDGFVAIVATDEPDEVVDVVRGERAVSAVAVTEDAPQADETSDADAEGERADEEPSTDPDAASEQGVLSRFASGVRGSLRATGAVLRSLPQLIAGQVTSVGAGTAAGGSTDGSDERDAGAAESERDAAAEDRAESQVEDEHHGRASAAESEQSGSDENSVADAVAPDATETSDATEASDGADASEISGDADDSAASDDATDASDAEDASDAKDASDAEDTDESASESSSSGVSSVRIDVDRLDELYGIVEQLYTNRIRLRRIVEAAGVDEAQEQLDALDKNTTQLQDAVMDMRLVPLSRVLDRFPRTVRDLARDQGKEIDLEIEGDGVEVDRVVLDEISDPLMHLVRNAVDHGLETPAEREAAGKPQAGTLSVRGRRERDQVVVEVADDGQGLDPDSLRDRAVEEDVETRAEVDQLSDDEVYELIFHSGFSTADEVTEVSGRGVGMDVVRQRVTELDGSVSVDSEPGEGTTVTLRLPVTVAIVEVLFVDVGDDTYGIPIKEIDRISRNEGIQTVNGERSIEYEDTIYPVIDLREFFEGETSDPDADRRLVRIHPDRRQIAILCDAVHDHEEVVVKPLAGPVANTPGLSGTTVLGDGDVVPIVDVQSIGG